MDELVIGSVRRAEDTFGYRFSGVRRVDVECLARGCWDELVGRSAKISLRHWLRVSPYLVVNEQLSCDHVCHFY